MYKIAASVLVICLTIYTTNASNNCFQNPAATTMCKVCSVLVENLSQDSCCTNDAILEKCTIAVNGLEDVKQLLSDVNKDAKDLSAHPIKVDTPSDGQKISPDRSLYMEQPILDSQWKRQGEDPMMNLLKSTNTGYRVPRDGAPTEYLQATRDFDEKRGQRGPFSSFSRAWYKGGKRAQRRLVQQ